MQGSELQIHCIVVIVTCCGAGLPFLEFRKLFRDSIALFKRRHSRSPCPPIFAWDPILLPNPSRRLIPKAYLSPLSSAVLSERVHGTCPNIARFFPAERFPRLGIRWGSPELESASPLCFSHIYHEALPFTVGAFLCLCPLNVTSSLNPGPTLIKA